MSKLPETLLLRRKIFKSLRKQGYELEKGKISLPPDLDKDSFRKLHSIASLHKLEEAEPKLHRLENSLITDIAYGYEVSPVNFRPKLIQVQSCSREELLFRYVSLHWSIPVSSGYGRRLRFLIYDEYNGKLVGALGLGDPVYALKARDNFIGWDAEVKRSKLWHIMDAYVLGAVPPYSSLLCGKLVAMLALSNEVRRAFKSRYNESTSLIRGLQRPPYLVGITSTSALGRSSLYNRIKVNGFEYWMRLGFTIGTGEFHFSNGLYSSIRSFAEDNCEPTAKQTLWGVGFRNKREVIRKGLAELGFSQELLHHGVKREIFFASLGRNALRFLRGETSRPGFYDWSADDLAASFKDRWLLPRSERMQDFLTFDRESYRLWANE